MDSQEESMKSEGRRRFAALIEREGGTYAPHEVEIMLGISEVELQKRTRDNCILMISLDREEVYPVWQFNGLKLTKGFDTILRQLDLSSPVAKVTYFLCKNINLGVTPIEYLRHNGVDELILRSARQFGRQGAT